MSQPSPSPLSSRLPERDAATLIGVSQATLRRYRFAGTGPRFLKLPGGQVFYHRSDLVAWLSSLVVDPTEEDEAWLEQSKERDAARGASR